MTEQPLHTDDSFPAMTPAQRLYFEVNGYVVIENALTAAECEELLAALEELRARFEAEENPAEAVIDCALVESWKPPHYFSWGHLVQAHPAFCRYLTHPRLVALVEEVVGGKVRLDESGAIVNRRLPDFDPGARFRYQWHRGGQPGFDSYTYGGLYHCTFVKTLTNLRDLGPEDGGTAVIAGSHKLNCNEDDMVGAAYEDPALVHQVVAPAGSTLMMCETLIHATGQNRGDGERAIIIGGYSHPKDMAMAGWEPTPEFLETQSEEVRELLSGRPFWTWPERHRRLGTPAGAGGVYKARMWSVSHGDSRWNEPS